MDTRTLINLIAKKVAAFIREDYAYFVIMGVGFGFLWLADKIFFRYSDSVSMMIYPLALFFICLVYLIAKVLARVITVLFRRPPR